MATCIPPIESADSSSRAEIRLFEALGRQLGPDYTVLHSVAWIARPNGQGPRDGETDLLILHPISGALVVEVKGGRVSLDYTRNEWTSVDERGVAHGIKNPFSQARRGKFGVLEKLRESPAWARGGVRRFNIGHAAFFPDVQNAGNMRGPDAPPDIIGDGGDMDALAAWVDGALAYWAGQEQGGLDRLGTRGVEIFVSTFARISTTRALLSARIRGEEAMRVELTGRQATILDVLRRQRRVMIAGGAGTGKTLLAREKAVRLAGDGMRTLLLCYNRGLADHLREQCGGIDRLDVATFHQVCDRWAKRGLTAGKDPLAAARRELPTGDEFGEILPLALANAICDLGPLYDAIVVDEAQDFGDEFWLPVEMLLTDLDTGMLYAFLDENQDVYSRSARIPIAGEPLVLDKNCRTSAAIHRVAYRHYRGSEVIASDIEGVPVECVQVSGIERQAKSVAAVVTRLVAEEKVPPHDIAILICDHGARAEMDAALRALPIPSAARLGRIENYGPGVITIDSVRRFKGLERPVVILWGFDGCNHERDRETLYVGMTRATSVLYLVGSKDACAWLVSDQEIRAG